MLWNQSVNSSIVGMFQKPTGADTLHALGAFQQDNSVRGLINGWQTPYAFIGAIHAVNGCRPVLASSGLAFQDFKRVI